ncbi:hypothetical protein SAMN02745126_06571 [Enhydrobacter aerosaccus]|uniref:Glycosyltransferase, GT2 family n=1 Tax=Enhydrobacter aerosaccus TaxID=225324 RepID=A0A1T4TNU3_9HYPH|nr:hypothetical protein [Enhydrobacter aerosaccus]SKA42110.1 hypothetical protein SAMN02745126_06571 [Enhydrobacter aerosaccus]
MPEVAVVFLVRGADPNWFVGVERFASSLNATAAGLAYKLYIILKGFASENEKAIVVSRFSSLVPVVLETQDKEFDIGAYRDALPYIEEDLVLFLNTHAEILAPYWLQKIAISMRRPGMGMVGATGSFESLSQLDGRFPTFPNVHVRTNAFMLRRQDAISMLGSLSIRSKIDAFLVESGPASLTRRFIIRGFDVAIVCRSGRSYPPPLWPSSGTFRQFDQFGLLIGDNQTRTYARAPWKEKRELVVRTWGKYLQMGNRVAWRLEQD